MGNILVGKEGDPDHIDNPTGFWPASEDSAAWIIRETIRFCNENRVYFDLHEHYRNVDDSQDAIDALGSNSNAGWAPEVPDQTVMLEFSPRADEAGSWYFSYGNQLDLYHDNPIGGGDDPERLWEDYIDDVTSLFGPGWEFGQYLTTGGFSMIDTIDNHIKPAHFALICYGPTLQGEDLSPLLKYASLRATWVDTHWITDSNQFTPIKVYWEDAIDGYFLDPFTPHDTACDPDRVCPPCENN